MTTDQLSPPWLWPRAAYVHVPFCAHRCGYCDFAVAAGQDHLFEPYVTAISQEFAVLKEPVAVDSIFIGGGTPTYLPVEILDRLLDQIQHWLPLRPGGEFSIEATPESVSADTVRVLKNHGVNRISLGVQSFQGASLETLDRIHQPTHIGPALDRIRTQIVDVSLDLIFGVPGQSLADWNNDLKAAISLKPEHISTYGLTFEKGTPLWKQREKGLLASLPEELELSMYQASMDRLPAAGYEQYEISNFAQPGRRCRHNETYWANEAYFGFGVGAARYVMGRRELNCRNTADYIRRMEEGVSPTTQSEELPAWEAAQETLAIQFRRSDGISRRTFFERTGFDYDAIVSNRATILQEEGLIQDTGESITLTRKGRCIADAIATRLAFG